MYSVVPCSILVQIESWQCKGRELEAAKVQLKDLEAKVAQLQLVVSTLQTFMYSQKIFSQASLLISTKYFQNRIIMFSLEVWYSAQCCWSGMLISDPGSECFPSWIPEPNFFHPGSPSNNNQKTGLVSELSEILSRLIIPNPDPVFYPPRILDPGVQKAPDPGSATFLQRSIELDA